MRVVRRSRPTNSFTPADLQNPPGKTIGTTNVLYPNFTVEVGKSHETWRQLLRDGEVKHFAPITGVVVYLGIKIYPNQRIGVCLLERDAVRGFGYVDLPRAQTGFIDINVPCNVTMVVVGRYKSLD